MNKVYFKGLGMLNNMMDLIKEKWTDEEGAGVIELAIIILILVGLAIVFKSEIDGILNGILNNLNKNIPSI